MRVYGRYKLVGLIVGAVAVGVMMGWRGSQAATEGPPAPRRTVVATVDIFRVFNTCQQTIDINELLQKRQEELKAEAEKQRKAIQLQEAALEPFAPGTPDYEQRNRELLNMRIKFEAWMRMTEAAIRRGYMQWTKQTYERITKAVAAVAKRRNIDIVLFYEQQPLEAPDAGKLRDLILQRKVVYASPQTDLTDEVLAEVNRSYQADGGKASIHLGI